MKNGITIRKAENEDVRQIAEILVEDWQKAYRGIMDDAFLDAMTDDRNEIWTTFGQLFGMQEKKRGSAMPSARQRGKKHGRR